MEAKIKNILNLIIIKNPKVLKIMNHLINFGTFLNILSGIVIYIYLRYYISVDLLFSAQKLLTASSITLAFSIICGITFSNYFLKTN